MVIYAIGTNANPIIGQTSNLELNKWGYIEAHEQQRTSTAGVFAGGDIVTGAATVILAMGAGRRAARSMKAYLGILDPLERVVSDPERPRIFGIDARQRNYRRVRVAA
jgi:glutamate synthase (NADPH/NADH) small chain